MSKSRLEKFLYALYSLDTSDLPNPLSRIEELYKCLVTGDEAPTFEPISRVEKYLMAILGGYDVELLPNPLSRVEVLLYKLATGDDNLDDIKSFLSEHEELLAGIIRNGGVGGNIDIEYVLYTLSEEHNTLYNTAKKPVKSAILKGNTLVNLAPKTEDTVINNYQSGRVAVLTPEFKPLTNLKANTEYTVFFKASNIVNAKSGMYQYQGRDSENAFIKNNITYYTLVDGYNKLTFTTSVEMSKIQFLSYNTFSDGGGCNIHGDSIMIIEGDYINQDIPYFEGMQSVKMPVLTTSNNNIFHGDMGIGCIQDDGSISTLGAFSTYRYTIEFFDIQKHKEFYITQFSSTNHNGFIIEYDENFNVITRSYGLNYKQAPYQIKNNNTKYVRLNYSSDVTEIAIEFAPITATTYEPYKSNILTVNEEVELCGIDMVQDELNLLTGELTQRIGEVVLDGSEEWVNWGTQVAEGMCGMYTRTNLENMALGENKNIIICDTLPIAFRANPSKTTYDSVIKGSNYIGITMANKTEKEIKAFLKSNPLTVQYTLKEKVVKTVDLSVVDQDGNDTKLSTFNDITYVALSSEGLIPEAELEVATKNEEVLNTMSLEMDDISTTQNILEETTNVQSENVDSTMIATTEIYEGLL